jgi:histone arginine demethylase JMJD6
MFVPSNWWHAVLNLDVTVAITQNVCNSGNFERVWLRTRKGRKKLSVKFLAELKEHQPELYKRAIAMNQRDGFVMWDQRPEYKKFFLPKHERKRLEKEQRSSSSDSSNSSSSSSSLSSVTSSSSSSSEADGSSSSKHRSPPTKHAAAESSN